VADERDVGDVDGNGWLKGSDSLEIDIKPTNMWPQDRWLPSHCQAPVKDQRKVPAVWSLVSTFIT
jgi:hypothetical protein